LLIGGKYEVKKYASGRCFFSRNDYWRHCSFCCKYNYGYVTELTTRHKTFGDIEIWAQKPIVSKGEEVPVNFYQEADKVLWMTKDGAPLLMIAKDVNDKIHGMYLLKNKDEPVLILEPLNSLGKWEKASYSNCRKGKPVGDVFIDINFDGCFDYKVLTDSNGNRVSLSIFINNDWQVVNHFNLKKMEATVGETEYLFDPNSGCWLEDSGVNK
jgi:hypothetical protein